VGTVAAVSLWPWTPAVAGWTGTDLVALGSDVEDIAAGDADGDGDQDLFWTGGGGVGYLRNDGGALTTSVTIDGGWYGRMHAADFDQDGDADLLVEDDGNYLVQFSADGSGSFDAPMALWVGMNRALSFTSADIDGDGDLEVFTALDMAHGADVHLWYLDMHTSGFDSHPLQEEPSPYDCRPAGTVDLGDIDGDGDLDLLMSHSGDESCGTATVSGTVSWYDNNGMSPLTWATHDVLTTMGAPLTVDGEALLGDVHLADVDGDDQQDMVLVYSAAPGATGTGVGGVDIMFGRGGARFDEPRTLTNVPRGISHSLVRDIDGDGRPDLAIAAAGRSAWAPNPMATTGDAEIIDDAAGVSRMTTIDLDNDGLHELVIADAAGVRLHRRTP